MSPRAKELKALVELSCSIRVYVPSTKDVDHLDAYLEAHWIDKTLKELSEWFGGSTSYDAMGCWLSPQKGLVKERVTIVEAFCESWKLDKYIQEVIELAEEIKSSMQQEAVSIEVNNKLYLI